MRAPELATNLVDPLDPPDDQLLQVELWRYAHVELHAQVIVICHKRPRRSAAWDHVHHGRLHLQEAAIVQEAPHRADDACARCKDVTHLVVGHQIQVALSVACFLRGADKPRTDGRAARPCVRGQTLIPSMELTDNEVEGRGGGRGCSAC